MPERPRVIIAVGQRPCPLVAAGGREGARMNPVNHQVCLAARPSGLPKPSDWELTTEPVPVPGPGEFVVAISYLSIDPIMRRLIDAAYREPVAIGAVMEAGAVGQVTASAHPGFAVG